MAAATTSSAAREALVAIAYELEAAPVIVSDIIDLGPYRDLDTNDGREHALVDAYSLLRNLLEASNEDGYDYTVAPSVAGLAGVSVRVAGGRGNERSPWLTLTSAYEVVLRTAETRLGITARLATPIGTVRVPIYTELAAAEARLAAVDCAPVRANQSATIAVTPSLADLSLADLDNSDFADFGAAMRFKSARVVDTALVKVDARSELALGGSTEQELAFSRAEIDSRVRKVAGTEDILQTAATSLSEDVSLQVSLLGLTLGSSASTISSVVGTALSLAAPAIDGVLTQVTSSLGVKLGAADVGVIGLRCGRPIVVA
jgi:uncharacterized membrane protein